MIYHVFTDYAPRDPETLRRNKLAQLSWLRQTWIEVPVRDEQLPRLFEENGRSFAYIKDILDAGCAKAKYDNDIVAYTNADIVVSTDCCRKINACLAQSDACYVYRRDFPRLDAIPPDTNFKLGHDYAGSDLIAFRKAWWLKHRDAMADGILGGEAWDPCSRVLIDETNPGKVTCVRDIICHERHNSYWEDSKNRYTLQLQHHCLKAACDFFEKRGIDPQTHSIPAWYLKQRRPKRALRPEGSRVFFHSGDLGDIIAALPVMRQLGGGKLLLGRSSGICGVRELMTLARYQAIEPLLQSGAPYLTVEYRDKGDLDADYDFSCFRHDECPGESLSHWQARHVGVEKLDLAPWLSVSPDPRSKGRVVIARSPRYHSNSFDWPSYLAKYQSAIFIGHLGEYLDFRRRFGDIEYISTANLREVAELIAGADLFIGNQSCPMWVAMAMGHRLIQEGYTPTPNSRIERDNATFVFGPVLEERVVLARELSA